jgi:NAD(P)H-flavin reductase
LLVNSEEWYDQQTITEENSMAKKEMIHTVVEAITALNPTTKMFRLRLPPDKTLPFKPGQFVMVHAPKDGKLSSKAYSICSSPSERDFIELCLNRIPGGYFSNFLCDLKGSEILPIKGPYGKFLLNEAPKADQIFVATGTGVAPIRSMIKYLFERETTLPVWLILGVRSESPILYEAEFREIATRHPNFRFLPTVSRPQSWTGEAGHVQDTIKKYIFEPEQKDTYLCGLPKMVDETRELLVQIGFKSEQIYTEKYI